MKALPIGESAARQYEIGSRPEFPEFPRVISSHGRAAAAFLIR
jgi:hypothetical protein